MTNYKWAISNGGAITAGGGAKNNTVTVKWVTAGAQTVSINYTNVAGSCTSATPTVYNVTVNALPVATITGPTTVSLKTIPTATYSTQAGMSNYVWTISGGTIQTGSTTGTVTVLWTSVNSSKISVSYVNPATGCTSNVATLNVQVKKSEEVVLNSNATTDAVPDVQLKFEIYPVPNDGEFTAAISSPIEDVYTIQVFNSIGIKMREFQGIKVNGLTKTNIDIRPTPPGLYTVVLLNSQNHAIRKILVNR